MDLKAWMERAFGEGGAEGGAETMTPTNTKTTWHAIKRIVFQILAGLCHCHGRRVLHRDLKPHNILVSADAEEVKLADFGLARAFHVPTPEYTREVVTQWYRPPEILLGSPSYTAAVDVWSVGCILGELLGRGTPLFPGDCEIDQLYKIFQLLGTPNAGVWHAVEGLEDFCPQFPQWRAQPLRSLFPELDPEGEALLSSMLRYDPMARVSAKAALLSPWFDEVRPPLIGASAYGGEAQGEGPDSVLCPMSPPSIPSTHAVSFDGAGWV